MTVQQALEHPYLEVRRSSHVLGSSLIPRRSLITTTKMNPLRIPCPRSSLSLMTILRCKVGPCSRVRSLFLASRSFAKSSFAAELIYKEIMGAPNVNGR